MNSEQILSKIAYLDSSLVDAKPLGGFSTDDIVTLVRDVIQLEMAKQGHLQKTEDVSARLISLEKRMEMIRREVLRQRGTPAVIYVRQHARVAETEKDFVLAVPLPQRTTLPTAMVLFYSLGLISSLAFATLLALSAVGVKTIHPFISLLGLIGGLGWLTTAWTDLLLWKREKPNGTEPPKEESTFAAVNAR